MDLEEEKQKTQVLILAGGTGKRMGNPETPKALMKVGGKVLIDWCIELYTQNGFEDYCLLVGHLHEKIEEYVGDGSKYGVKMRYCVDPPLKKVGKGKALKNAILKRAIDLYKRTIITYPDDIYLDKRFPTDFLKAHLDLKERRNIIATVAYVPEVEYPYGVLSSSDGKVVEEFHEKPVVKIPTAIGSYVVEPEVFKLIEEKVDMGAEEAVEFENVVLPYLAKEKKLGMFSVDHGKWIPINTQKELEVANKILSKK